MPFPTAISSDQQTDLRAYYSSDTYLAWWQETVVFVASLNQDTQLAISSLTFDTVTTGAYTAILEGYTVYVHDPAINWYDTPPERILRARRNGAGNVATPDILYINQTSAFLTDNDTITVTKDVRFSEKLPRYDEDTDTIFFDFDVAFTEPPPVIYNLQSAYAKVLSGGVADFAFAPLAVAMTSGASISTWAWSLDGGSFQSGSASTQNITARFSSAGCYLVRLTVTDSGGRSTFIVIKVYVVAANFSNVVFLGEDDVQYQADVDNGYTASLRAVKTITGLSQGAEAIIFTASELFGDDSTPVVSSVNFVGRLRTRNSNTSGDALYAALTQSQLTLEGILTQMGRVNVPSMAFQFQASPTVLGEVNNLTPTRASAVLFTQLTNLNNVCSIQFEDTSNTYLTPLLGVDSGTVIDAVNTIQSQINAQVVQAGQGEIYIGRNVSYLDSGDRPANAIVDFVLNDLVSLDLQDEDGINLGQVIGYGFSWFSSTDTNSYARAKAPGVIAKSPGQAELNDQLIDANSTLPAIEIEIASRVARFLAQSNPKAALDVELPGGYHWIVPCVHQVYTFTLSSNDTVDGTVYDDSTQWVCTSITVVVDNVRGYKAVTARFEVTTDYGDSTALADSAPFAENTPSSNIPISWPTFGEPITPGLGYGDEPDDGDNKPDDGKKPKPDSEPPPDGSDAPTPEEISGDVVLGFGPNGAAVSQNFGKKANPSWSNITPGTGIVSGQWNPFGNGVALLQQDSPNSNVWRTGNALAGVSWAATVLADALYTLLRYTSQSGKLYAYAPSSANVWQHTFAFDTPSGSDPDTTYGNSWTINTGTYSAGNGYRSATSGVFPNQFQQLRITEALASDAVITGIDVNYTTTVAGNGTAGSLQEYSLLLNSVEIDTSGGNRTEATGTYTDTYAIASVLSDEIQLQYRRPGTTTGVMQINYVVVRGTGPDPFVASDNAITAYSSNGGATFAAPVIVGTSPGSVGGLDTQRVGADVLAAAYGQVREATNGGTYGDEPDGATSAGQPICIVFYGKSATNYLFGQSALASNAALYKVEGGIAADITPYDGVNYGIPVSANAVWVATKNNNRIYGIFSFGGTRKFARSTDGGSTWTIVGTSGAGSDYVRTNPYNDNQVTYVDGTTIYYSTNGGASFVTRQAPFPLAGLEFKR